MPSNWNHVAIAISVIALVIAFWAAHETRETRLDSRRSQLRGEALAFLQEAQSTINTFNCYALVKGVTLNGKEELKAFLADKDRFIRNGLSELAEFSPEALGIYEKHLNDVKGRLQNGLNADLMVIRNSWDKELREKADSVCKL